MKSTHYLYPITRFAFVNPISSALLSLCLLFGTVSTAYAKWRSEGGNTIRVVGHGSGTTGGSASNTITASIPISATLAASLPVGSARVTDGGASVTGFCFLTTTVNVRRYDSANYGLGGGRNAVYDAVYEF